MYKKEAILSQRSSHTLIKGIKGKIHTNASQRELKFFRHHFKMSLEKA